MNANGHILVCGRDAELLSLRALVLKSAGYRVSTLTSVEALPNLETVKLLIVCHTLPDAERQIALSAVARHSPDAVALLMLPTSGAIPEGVETLDSLQGPRQMLDTVTRLLTKG